MGIINDSSEITWMENKILNDPSLSARLYYTTKGDAGDKNYNETEKIKNNNYLIAVGTSTVAPSFSISHDWSNVMTSGLSSIFNNSLTYLLLFMSSMESNLANSSGPMSLLSKALLLLPWVGKYIPSSSGNYLSTILSNIITGSYNDLFKLYSGTRVNILTPDLTIYFLPTDDPTSSDLDFSSCPLYKLKALLNWNPSKYGINYSNSTDVDEVMSGLLDLVSKALGLVGVNVLELGKSALSWVIGDNTLGNLDNLDLSKLDKLKLTVSGFVEKSSNIANNISKIVDKNNGSLMGNTSYIKSLMVSSAPLKYRRGFNYDDDPRLLGTCLLKVNGIKYPNLLISDINVNYSLTKLINNNTDYGPSWIKVTFSFVPAIDYTLRDISRMIGDKLSSMNFKSIDLTVNGNSILETLTLSTGDVVATSTTTDYALDLYDKVNGKDEYIKMDNSLYVTLEEKLASGTVSPTGNNIQGYLIINNVENNNSSLSSTAYDKTVEELNSATNDLYYGTGGLFNSKLLESNRGFDTNPGISLVDNLEYTSREFDPIYVDKDGNEVDDPNEADHVSGYRIIYYKDNLELKTVTSKSSGLAIGTKYTDLGASLARFNK